MITIKYSSNDRRRPRRRSPTPSPRPTSTWRSSCAPSPRARPAQWFDEQLDGRCAPGDAGADQAHRATRSRRASSAPTSAWTSSTARLAELNTQMLAARNAFYDAQTQLQAGAELLASGGSRSTPCPRCWRTPHHRRQGRAAGAPRACSQDASTDLGPNHPVYIKHSAEVQGLREQLSTRDEEGGRRPRQRACSRRRSASRSCKAAVDAQQARIMQAKDARVELAVDDARRRERAAQLRHGAHPRHEHASSKAAPGRPTSRCSRRRSSRRCRRSPRSR